MTDLENLLAAGPYALKNKEKAALYSRALSRLTAKHYDACPNYRKMLDGLKFDPQITRPSDEQPLLPVRLFKEFDLKSVPDQHVLKTMTSSGTSGQAVSKIYLDKTTASAQTKVLAKIVSNLIGPKRLPMLVIDARETVKNRTNFSARGAGIIGFSLFGRDVTFALNADMSLNTEQVAQFCTKHQGTDIFIFGFTSIIYQHFILPLQQLGKSLPLERATLLHGGGWKKLEDIAVSNTRYKQMLQGVAGIDKIHNYYGMVEQTGSIFTECLSGHLHASVFSDIIIRDAQLNVAPPGSEGLVQLVSLLPESYPGHSILTEDIGQILGEDNCSCGRMGKYFRILGRAKQAEIRGCSDTYAA
jgi:phenylacetate-coenzyme A ligase PaaK-like adenylate-forming protein